MVKGSRGKENQNITVLKGGKIVSMPKKEGFCEKSHKAGGGKFNRKKSREKSGAHSFSMERNSQVKQILGTLQWKGGRLTRKECCCRKSGKKETHTL